MAFGNSRMSRKQKEQTINDFLNATKANTFDPRAFVLWVEGQPEHPAYKLLFSKDDKDAAMEYRIALARRMASGLRIRVRVEEIPQTTVRLHSTAQEVVQAPMLISVRSERTEKGGAYVHNDLSNPTLLIENFGQAADDLIAWLARWGDVAKLAGVDVDSVEATVGRLQAQALENEDAA